MMLRILLTTFAFLSLAPPTLAASSGRLENEGGAVRLVTSGLADQEGRLRGALEIELKPGWKTYWRNPGESGVPPQLDLSNSPEVENVEILFPAPRRIRDDYAVWAGYEESVTLPVVFTLSTPGGAGIIEGSVFLGICDTICIPFHATFSFDAGADPDNEQDAAVVEAAFAALPERASEAFEVEAVLREEQRLLFHADVPKEATSPGLFIATPEGMQIAVPQTIMHEGNTVVFSADILAEPVSSEGRLRFDYTLVADEKAVAGGVTLDEARNEDDAR